MLVGFVYLKFYIPSFMTYIDSGNEYRRKGYTDCFGITTTDENAITGTAHDN